MKVNNRRVKIFISSSCGNEAYNYVRHALKKRLEETNLIEAYVFEKVGPSTMCAEDAYLSDLEDSHLILFLIDNEKEMIPEGVMKEWQLARRLNKKSIYIFCNNPDKEITTIQNEITGAKSEKYEIVKNIDDFEDSGYVGVIDDIVKIFVEYCKDNFIYKSRYEEAVEADKVILSDKFSIDRNQYLINKGYTKKYAEMGEIFRKLNPYYSNLQKESTDIKSAFGDLAYMILCEKPFEENVVGRIISEIAEECTEKNLIEIIQKRWQCINLCYKDELDQAILLLDDCYNKAVLNGLDEWIQSDILIDKRNLENLKNQLNNVYKIIPAQVKLDQSNIITHYPILDRLSENIYESISNEVKKNNNNSPYSTQVGTSIDNILSMISEYFVIAVHYGSWTHLNKVIRLLKDTFIQFWNLHNTDEWGIKALKFSILDDDSKEIKKICDRNMGIISTCSFDKIHKLYEQVNNVGLSKKREYIKISVFKELGLYFSDEYYELVENEFFRIINRWLYSDKPVVSWENNIFTCIEKNFKRIDKDNLTQFILQIVDMKYYRFWDSAIKILSYLESDSISVNNQKKIIGYAVEMIKNNNQRENLYNLERLILSIRLSGYKNNHILDSIIEENWNDFYNNNYRINVFGEDDDYKNTVISLVKELKVRNSTQGISGYAGYGYYICDRILNLIKNQYSILDNNNICSDMMDAIKECLNNKKQVVSEKVSCIRLLMYLQKETREARFNFNWELYFSNINFDNWHDGYVDEFFQKDNQFILELNIKLMALINNKLTLNSLLETLQYMDEKDSYEKIQYVKSLVNYINTSKESPEFNACEYILFYELIKCIDNKDFEVRYNIVNALFSFYKKREGNIIINSIFRMVNDDDYRIKLNLLNCIQSIDTERTSDFKSIIEKLRIDNNYLVREYSKELEKKYYL